MLEHAAWRICAMHEWGSGLNAPSRSPMARMTSCASTLPPTSLAGLEAFRNFPLGRKALVSAATVKPHDQRGCWEASDHLSYLSRRCCHMHATRDPVGHGQGLEWISSRIWNSLRGLRVETRKGSCSWLGLKFGSRAWRMQYCTSSARSTISVSRTRTAAHRSASTPRVRRPTMAWPSRPATAAERPSNMASLQSSSGARETTPATPASKTRSPSASHCACAISGGRACMRTYMRICSDGKAVRRQQRDSQCFFSSAFEVIRSPNVLAAWTAS